MGPIGEIRSGSITLEGGDVVKETREAGVMVVRFMVIAGTVLFFAAIAIASQDLVLGLILVGISWGVIVYAAYLAHYYKLDIGPNEGE